MFNITNSTKNSSVLYVVTGAIKQYVEPEGSKYFRWFCFTVFSLAAVIGNSIVIHSILSIRVRRPLAYKLVTNVAVAELLGVIFLPLIFIYDEVYSWPFESLLCHLASPIQISSCLVITWSLAFISLHRFRMLKNRRLRGMNELRYQFGIGSLWASAVIISFPSFLYSTVVKNPYDGIHSWCVVLFPGDTLNTFPSPVYRRYLMVRFVINFLVPILIMVLAYGAMGIKLKCHMAKKRLRNRGLPSIEVTTDEGYCLKESKSGSSTQGEEKEMSWSRTLSPDSLTQSERNKKLQIKLERDLLRMIYAIILVFVVCYFPYQVLFLLEYFDVVTYKNWRYFHITRKYVFLNTCLQSVLHPLCYGTMSAMVREASSMYGKSRTSASSAGYQDN
ncbi:neuromedin-K receptor-like isoform X2 [Actinia tenebrosa]|uniref:Neuromedin-K receptor-like isoform X2 n=1 Tax=Actinia tenebrosa TaxID=6105 RepID=A0A6P8HAR3_ACTTE|nr:neuromedin-K receptor-like isoform X2 [Actinia tenebrosa]